VRKAKASLGISDREIAEYIDVAAKPLRAYFSNDLKLDCMTSLSYLGASGEELLCIDIEVNADTEDLERLNEQVADELSAHSFGVNVEKYFSLPYSTERRWQLSHGFDRILGGCRRVP
jgi:hypothetical protein